MCVDTCREVVNLPPVLSCVDDSILGLLGAPRNESKTNCLVSLGTGAVCTGSSNLQIDPARLFARTHIFILRK